MNQQHGWFEYGENPRRITNSLTGQSLTVLSGDAATASSRLRCQYEDPELKLPIDVVIHRSASSAAIELGYPWTFSVSPTYGCWRRIDDFLTDACLNWQEGEFNPELCTLTVFGGWRSGVWQPQLQRVFSASKGETPWPIQDCPIAEPYFFPLDLKPPGAWRYSDIEKPAAKAELEFECSAPSNVPYLDITAAPLGFQGLVPFLERAERQAYIFPARLEPHSNRGEDPMALVWYTYVDPDIFFTFRSYPFFGLELSSVEDYGFRQSPPLREFWATDRLGNPVPGDTARPSANGLSRLSSLSHRVWRDTLIAIGDAWPMWRYPARRIEADASIELPDNYGKVASVGDYGPRVHGGYSAGIRNSRFDLRFP
jgi:hypothetical protein